MSFPQRYSHGMGPLQPFIPSRGILPFPPRYPVPFAPRMAPYGNRGPVLDHRPSLRGAPGAAISRGCNLIRFDSHVATRSGTRTPSLLQTGPNSDISSTSVSVSETVPVSSSTSLSVSETVITSTSSSETLSVDSSRPASETDSTSQSVGRKSTCISATHTFVKDASLSLEEQCPSVPVSVHSKSNASCHETGVHLSKGSKTKSQTLTKGLKTGMSLKEFLETTTKSKKRENQPKTVDQTSIGGQKTKMDKLAGASKVTLADILCDTDKDTSWMTMTQKFGLTEEELIDEAHSPVDSREAGTKADQAESSISKMASYTSGEEEVSLSDFIWDHEGGTSWESIEEKIGLTTNELGVLPPKTVGSISTQSMRTNSSNNIPSRIDQLKRGVTDSDKHVGDSARVKSLKTTHSSSDAFRPVSLCDVIAADTDYASPSNSLSERNKASNKEKLKRKLGPVETDVSKKQKLLPESGEQGPVVKMANPKIFMGNVYSAITKDMVDKLFEFIPGIIAWCLRRHKTSYSKTCIIVEMTSELSARNLLNVFQGIRISDREVTCRHARPLDESVYEVDTMIKSANYIEPEADSPRSDEKKVFIGNLPSSITKAKVDELLEFVPGIVSYKLRRHKEYSNVVGVIAEMSSDIAGENIRKTLNGSEVDGRRITCRHCSSADEEVFVKDFFNTLEEKTQKTEEARGKAIVFIGDLPSNTSEAQLKDYIYDLTYECLDFTPGEKSGNQDLKPAHAIVHFNHNEDAEKMVRELKDGFFFGNSFEVELQYQQNEPSKQTDTKTWLSGDAVKTKQSDHIEKFRPSHYTEKNRLSELVEKNRPSDYVEKTRLLGHVEKTRPPDHVEKTRLSDHVEKTRASDYVENTRLSGHVEKTRQSDHPENTRPSEYVEKTRLFGYVEKTRPYNYVETKRMSDDAEKARPPDYLEKTRLFGHVEKTRPSDYVEQTMSSDFVENTRPSDYVEMTRLSGHVEKTRPFDYLEKARLSDHAKMASGSVEKTRPSGHLEGTRLYDYVVKLRSSDHVERTRSYSQGKTELKRSGREHYRPASLKAVEGYLSETNSTETSPSVSSHTASSSCSTLNTSFSGFSSQDVYSSKPRGRREGSAQLDKYLQETDYIPVIGLDYVTELTVPNQSFATYHCGLCDASPQGSEIVAHLASHKHRLKYLERRLPLLFHEIMSKNLKKSELTAELTKHATQIEKRKGRGSLKQVLEQKRPKPVLSFSIDEEEENVKDDTKDTTSDLFSRISAFKNKMKQMEGKQKDEEKMSEVTESTETASTVQQRNLPWPEKGPNQRVIVDNVDDIVKQLEQTKSPVLGLSYIGYQPNSLKPNMPFYNCTLCQCQSYLKFLVNHVTGASHLIMYFKRNCFDIYERINLLSKRADQIKLAQEQAKEMERRYGRGILHLTGESKNKDTASTKQPNIISNEDTAQQTVTVTSSDDKTRDESEVQDMEVNSEEETVEIEYYLPDGEGIEEEDSSKAKLFEMIGDRDDCPLVGLRYVTEVQSCNNELADYPKYNCRLCDTKVTKSLILTHLTGHQHKSAFIRENYPETFEHAKHDREKVDGFCRYIERQKGREPINVVTMMAPKNSTAPVTYTRLVRVKAPVVKLRQTPSSPLRVITPPTRVITPPLTVVSPPIIVSVPAVVPTPSAAQAMVPPPTSVPTMVQTPAAVSAFLARSLSINVQTVTARSTDTAVDSNRHTEYERPVVPSLVEIQPTCVAPPATEGPLPAVITTSGPARDEKQPDTETENIKLVDRKMIAFSDIAKGHEKEPLLGLSSCVEIQHPSDTEPPLFQCNLCKLGVHFREIVPHITGRNHKLEFFKQMHPKLHTLIVTQPGRKEMNHCLNSSSQQNELKNGREKILRVIAKNDSPWKTWSTDSQAVRYNKTDTAVTEGIVLKPGGYGTEINEITGTKQDQTAAGIIDATEKPVDSEGQGSKEDSSGTSDRPQQFEVKKDTTPAVNERQGIVISELVKTDQLDDGTWEAVHAEIERRINNKSIIVVQKPSKFIKTYKPFLDKFPVIGLEGLTEFTKPDQNTEPWYLCRLCHMKIDWDDVVDHVLTVLHRIKYIEKEHPQLYSLLTRSVFESKKELKNKIEEFSRGVAKPPTEFAVKVMLELAVTQEQLDSAMETKEEAQVESEVHQTHSKALEDSDKPDKLPNKPERVPANPDGVQAKPDRVPERPERVPEKETVMEPYGTAPIVKDYYHQSLPKPPATSSIDGVRIMELKPRFPERFGGKTKRAIVGLEHLTEYQPKDTSAEPDYFCNLCDAKLGTRTVMQHLMGLKHRLSFFAKRLPDVYGELTRQSADSRMSRTEVIALAEQYAVEYEQEHGRGEVKVVLVKAGEDNITDKGIVTDKSSKSMLVTQKQTLAHSSFTDKTLNIDQNSHNQLHSLVSKTGTIQTNTSRQSLSGSHQTFQKATFSSQIGQITRETSPHCQKYTDSQKSFSNSDTVQHSQMELSQTVVQSGIVHSPQAQVDINRNQGQALLQLRQSQTAQLQQSVQSALPTTQPVPLQSLPVTGQIIPVTSQMPVAIQSLPMTGQVIPVTKQMRVANQQIQIQGQAVTQSNLQQPANQFNLLVQKQVDMIKQKELELQMKSVQQQSDVPSQPQPGVNQAVNLQRGGQQQGISPILQPFNVIQQQQIPGLAVSLQSSTAYPLANKVIEKGQQIIQQQNQQYQVALQQTQQLGHLTPQNQQNMAPNIAKAPWHTSQPLMQNHLSVRDNSQNMQPSTQLMQAQQNLQYLQQIPQSLTQTPLRTVQVSQGAVQQMSLGSQSSATQTRPNIPQYSLPVSENKFFVNPQHVFQVKPQSVIQNRPMPQTLNSTLQIAQSQQYQFLSQPSIQQQKPKYISQQTEVHQNYNIQQQQQALPGQQNIATGNLVQQHTAVQKGLLQQTAETYHAHPNSSVLNIQQSVLQRSSIQQQTICPPTYSLNQQMIAQSGILETQQIMPQSQAIPTSSAAQQVLSQSGSKEAVHIVHNPLTIVSVTKSVTQNILGFSTGNTHYTKASEQSTVVPWMSSNSGITKQIKRLAESETAVSYSLKYLKQPYSSEKYSEGVKRHMVSGRIGYGRNVFTESDEEEGYNETSLSEPTLEENKMKEYSRKQTSDSKQSDLALDQQKPEEQNTKKISVNEVEPVLLEKKIDSDKRVNDYSYKTADDTKTCLERSPLLKKPSLSLSPETKGKETIETSSLCMFEHSPRSEKLGCKESAFSSVTRSDEISENKSSHASGEIVEEISETDRKGQANKSLHILKNSGEVKVLDNFSVTITRTNKNSRPYLDATDEDSNKNSNYVVDRNNQNSTTGISSTGNSRDQQTVKQTSEESDLTTSSFADQREIKVVNLDKKVPGSRKEGRAKNSSDATKGLKYILEADHHQKIGSTKNLQLQKKAELTSSMYEAVSDEEDDFSDNVKPDTEPSKKSHISLFELACSAMYELIESSSESEAENAESNGKKSSRKNIELIEISSEDEVGDNEDETDPMLEYQNQIKENDGETSDSEIEIIDEEGEEPDDENQSKMEKAELPETPYEDEIEKDDSDNKKEENHVGVTKTKSENEVSISEMGKTGVSDSEMESELNSVDIETESEVSGGIESEMEITDMIESENEGEGEKGELKGNNETEIYGHKDKVNETVSDIMENKVIDTVETSTEINSESATAYASKQSKSTCKTNDRSADDMDKNRDCGMRTSVSVKEKVGKESKEDLFLEDNCQFNRDSKERDTSNLKSSEEASKQKTSDKLPITRFSASGKVNVITVERPSSESSEDFEFQQMMESLGENFVTVDELDFDNKEEVDNDEKESDIEDGNEFIEIDTFKAESDGGSETDGEYIDVEEFVTLDEEGGQRDTSEFVTLDDEGGQRDISEFVSLDEEGGQRDVNEFMTLDEEGGQRDINEFVTLDEEVGQKDIYEFVSLNKEGGQRDINEFVTLDEVGEHREINELVIIDEEREHEHTVTDSKIEKKRTRHHGSPCSSRKVSSRRQIAQNLSKSERKSCTELSSSRLRQTKRDTKPKPERKGGKSRSGR